MDKITTSKINSILKKLTESAVSGYKKEMSLIRLNDDGTHFFTNAMRRDAIRAAERSTQKLIDQAVTQVSDVSRVPRAFELIYGSINNHFLDLEEIIDGGGGLFQSASTAEALPIEFDRVRARLFQILELHRPKFPTTGNTGGRPRSEDWDRMMAYFIAKANSPDGLLEGKLASDDPDREITADELESEMANWFAVNTDKSPEKKELKPRVGAVIKALSERKKAKN